MSELTTAELAERVQRTMSLRRLIEAQAATYGDKIYLRFEDQAWTYSDTDLAANRAANGLAARGVCRGDTIAVMMRNCPEWIAVWFGALKLGAVTVPVNSAYTGDGLAYQLNHCHASLMFLDEEMAPRVGAIRSELRQLDSIVVQGGSADELGAEPMASFLDGPSTAPPAVDLHPSDPAAILYTSGTTGPPKGCVLPHGQYIAAAHQMNDNCEYGSDDVLYTTLPLSHINAQNYSVLCSFVAGGTLVLESRFSASTFWTRLIESGATAFNFIGGMPVMLWNQPTSVQERLHSARVAFGAPVPIELWPQWEERFGVRIVYAYGMTENGLPTLYPFADTPTPASRRGSGGRPSASAEVQIVDEDDQPLEAGVVGEICTRPKVPWTMMLEYFENPTATIEAFRNCWFHTGDLGYLDEGGYLFYVDRKKDAIRRRGEMVSSWDVESVVGKFEGILECAAVGVPSDVGEEEILVAVVVQDASLFEPQEMHAFCSTRMAKFQVPRYVRVVEELPRTHTQRVEKYKIRAAGVTGATWDAAVASG